MLDQFVACFEGLEDPRTGNAGLHDFHELLVIALCTVLSGGQGATHMEAFAVAKESFLRGFLRLEHGLPSHDTFSRLFRLLDPEQFRAAFQRFMARFSETVQGVVAIDGKVLRRSFDRASGRSPLHMVSAWGCEQRMVLAQIATDGIVTLTLGGRAGAEDGSRARIMSRIGRTSPVAKHQMPRTCLLDMHRLPGDAGVDESDHG